MAVVELCHAVNVRRGLRRVAKLLAGTAYRGDVALNVVGAA